ncbi:unnamed protein product [Diabrotica balteata]|uniref:Rotatin N-terminal domain-containing protein n=1 Tax=Diabrotica balteata TaxID=107213 RepID=A0A9N9SST5_DIABA|nr:unnamed protein product [Diabrotica balteata]
MGDKFINSNHIEKLGHKIQEIRERALKNIISKLDNGVAFDNDLARCKELLNKLLKWFLLEPNSQEELVLALLKRTLESEHGKVLIDHIGKETILHELQQISTYLEPKFIPLLKEIISLVNSFDTHVVPPLECDVPLSYRSATSAENDGLTANLGTTATAQEGFLHKESSAEQQTAAGKITESSLTTPYDDRTYRIQDNLECETVVLPNIYFEWQPLIESDRHVLNSVESSLVNPPQPSSLLHSCEFFRDVLLHDFPAEIFLQRPRIILEFFSLLNCGSFRITNSVLSCLCDLTTELQVRINHCNDISLQNFKLKNTLQLDYVNTTRSQSETNRGSDINEIQPEIRTKFERPEEIAELQKHQVSTVKYCLFCIDSVFKYLCVKPEITKNTRHRINQVAINFCLILLEKILQLMTMCVEKNIWSNSPNETSVRILRDLNEIFVKYGTSLEHFRIESVSFEKNLQYRVIYLYLLHNTTNLLQALVPYSKCASVLPRNLRSALSNSLLDVTFSRLYPEVHNKIFTYIQNFSPGDDKEHLRKYEDVKKVCQGMTATVKFLKEYKNLSYAENIRLASDALASIEFHKDLDFVKVFVDVCSEGFSQIADDSLTISLVEDIILSLLNHAMVDIRLETYRLCHKTVVTYIGPKLNDTTGIIGSQVIFLLNSKILVEITCFGLNNDNLEIRKYSEEILTYILKCKMIVSESIWNKVIQALIPSLPIITSQITNKSILGKSLIYLVDPDVAKESLLPVISMIKCNVEILFLDDSVWREEAFSRICWLLSSQDNFRELLPGFNTLYDTSLTGICKIKKMVDVNKIRRTEHFYQPSSLYQVLEVLNSTNIEPVIKRSALNQISVMLEDPLLHQIFLDSGGLSLLLNVMKSALTEKDYSDYPDSIIPTMSVFKNICFYNANVREELSHNVDIFYYTLRGLLLFFTEERFKQDAIIVLFLLVFKDFIRGSPSRANFSLPEILISKINLPFTCHSHWTISEYTKNSLRDSITSDRWCLSSIQIQWNAEIFGGFDKLIQWDEINYENHSMYNFVDILKLNDYDLQCIKNSSIDHCVKHYLKSIQNATSHDIVLESIDNLTLYVCLHQLACEFNENYDKETFKKHQWENTFLRFLKVLPSSEHDTIVLKKILQFLCILIPYYSSSNSTSWITNFLKKSTQCIFDLLNIDNTSDDDLKIVAQELLKVITLCAKQEQDYLDYYIPMKDSQRSWLHIIKIIAENLKNSGKQHFYNLAYLDSLLSCLVHLTANLGWSENKPNLCPTGPLPQLIVALCDLVKAFHSGKGPTAAVSVMGLSITRHVMLVLNHLLAEVKSSKIKGWETYFFDNIEDIPLYSFIALWASRDVILRAASLQLFAGFTSSSRAVIEIVHGFGSDTSSIWDLSLRVLIDYTEANTVRESAAEILANLTSHCAPLGSEKACDNTNFALKKSSTLTLMDLIDEHDFYNCFEIILNDLFTTNIPYRKFRNLEKIKLLKNGTESEKSWTSSSDSDINSLVTTTPSLVKTVCNFLYNLLALDAVAVSQTVQEKGLVKLIFRALCNPNMTITNTRELSLYVDILDMNATICSVLTRLASNNISCLGTVLHTRDCLNLLVSLLNPRLYHMDYPQLVYLRNRLWTSVFNLLSTLVEYGGESEGNLTNRSVEVVNTFSGTITELGNEPFFEAICESISNLGSHDLQNSALNMLTGVLRVEAYRNFEYSSLITEKKVEPSIQSLLDSVKTSRTVLITNNDSARLPKNSKKLAQDHKLNLLEEVYYEKVIAKPQIDLNDQIEVSIIENDDQSLMSGAEICKILLYLYDICNFENTEVFSKKKAIVTKALSTLLCVSKEAKQFALECSMVGVIVKRLRDHHIRLGLESVDCLRRVADKKRLCPLLKELDDLICLLTNFMIDCEPVKLDAASLNLADVIHKLWVWFLVENYMLIDVLKMICTYTTNCELACQTLPLTSPVAGSGPRKSPGTISLLHAIIALISREMDQISKTHDLSALEISFNILHNSCQSLECRILISKSNIFQSISRLHPAITKRQKPWEFVELIWLDFLQTYTIHPEGQAAVAKIPDVLELIMTLTNSSKMKNRLMAIMVLRNATFYQPNKTRLLSSADFLNIVQSKLTTGSDEEKNIVVVIIWALAANSQKAKIVLKSIHLDDKLQNVLKHCQLLKSKESCLNTEDIDRMQYVLQMLRDTNDKIK